ncbi:MAG: type II secretion system ATPase GspE [Sedimentisphaerales bacterium]|jgi:general secretion pathway protein E/type IV pilus assembly protein PilB|nr:type II secretion system ATPase GspE [Sedimentisphaerales bacterium]HNY77149.1 type II secretion system ATPase GspE [Sedimentisphaerales bacterium]HOC62435.1 type II secretion system ATPase GspE [Sedimentisphaerales bacterium]HOH62953.1 type II secretion system ATPase GspE [Sedimentisphaerales bacterium]HPY50081.1 type II secretion system ATPase GspE [Sedimentisphaerales bacterium]
MNTLLEKMVEQGLIDESAARGIHGLLAAGEPPTRAFAACGLAEEALLRFWSSQFDCPYVEMDKCAFSKEFLSRFPARVLLDKHVMPVENGDGRVLVVTSNPFDTSAIDELRLATGQDFQVGLAPLADIDRCIKQHLGVGADTVQSMLSEAGENGLQVIDTDSDDDMDLTDAAEGASIIRFVNQILSEAIEMRATDVHIEPFEETLRVRYRIDGVLQEASVAPEVKQFQAAIVSRLKILSKLDIAEKRIPQDGRIKIRIADHEIDVRVSVIPMLYGEAVVLRLLDRSSVLLGLDKLGMSPRDLKVTKMILERPHGIILVTGPTGSGKTTTLYAGLSQINDIQRKIITIEDPIEYQLHGINQIQVSRKAGLTFASGLRSILRHDPDVVLVGEIRDVETAEIAIQASLTGHLVFSTLHTNDAPTALTRLVDMGIEPYLVASSLEAVIAQRLVRTICPECKEELPEQEVAPLRRRFGDRLPAVLYKGRGCRNCQGTGYRGRMGIFEMMVVTDDVRSLILDNASPRDLRMASAKQGMTSLRDDGFRHLHVGRTTVEEILRVTKDDMFEPMDTADTSQERQE